MWIRLLHLRRDNPLFVQARRRLRRRWWRSWVAPALAMVVAFYGLLVAAYLDLGIGAPGSSSEFAADHVLRAFLLILSPLIALFGFFGGARSIQREREKGTLESLLLTRLTNEDLLAGKILGTLLPFFLVCLLLVPAILQFGIAESVEVPSFFTSNWRLQEIIESFWYLPHWELLIYIFVGATLGVVYGVHRAATHRHSSMIYSSGMITFMLLIPFAMVFVSHLLQFIVEVVVNIASGLIRSRAFDFEPFKPYVRVVGMLLGAWLLSLVPLFELVDRFRYLCGDERDPRELAFRRPMPGSGATHRVPWSPDAAKPPDIWADYEERHKGRPQPRSAIGRPPADRATPPGRDL